jgi:hypothetical protein
MSAYEIDNACTLTQSIVSNLKQVFQGKVYSWESESSMVERALDMTKMYHRINNNGKLKGMSVYKVRTEYASYISWVLVDKGLIDWILKMCQEYEVKQLLEINSGHGFVGALIRHSERDFDVILTDPFLSHNSKSNDTFTEVECLTSDEAIETHCNDDNIDKTILMSIWPCKIEDYAGISLINFREKGGKYFIYIGGNCTGTKILHDELKQNWNEVEIFHNKIWFIKTKLDFADGPMNDYTRFYTVKD